MQKLTILLAFKTVFFLLGIQCYSQSNLEKLTEIRNNLLLELQAIEKEIEKEVSNNGNEIILDRSLTVKEFPGAGRTIAQLNKGDRISLLGKESIYYKVKTGNLLGYAFLAGVSYPTNTNQTSSYTETPSNIYEAPAEVEKTQNSTEKGCGATQCSGKTKKGARCKNRTKNCSGRCHLH